MKPTLEQRRRLPSGWHSPKDIVVDISPEPLRLSMVIGEMWNARELVFNLSARNLKGRYRGTSLGNWWLLIRPIIGVLPYFVVFGLFMKVSTDPLPYIVFLLSGFGPWQLFGTQLTASPAMMVKMRSMVEKIYFPRLIVPLVELVTRVVDFVVIIIVAVLVALAFGVRPSGPLWAFPLFMFLLLILSFGAGLVVTTLCTLRPDLGHGVQAATRILFYASAVFYPLSVVPESIRSWFELNPLVTILYGIRWSLFGVFQPSVFAIGFAVAFAGALLWLGLHMFLRVERSIADVL
jgi:homopolymeric O-antigen transport system permease protein